MNHAPDQYRRPNSDLSEEYRLAMAEWARLDGEARRKDALRKRIFSQLVIGAEAKSVAMAENIARTDNRYELAEADAINGETAANIAKAEVEAIKIRFEVWRTIAATARAEMSMR